MTTRFRFIAILAICLAAGCQREQRKMTDQQSIQGIWQLVAGERHGTPFSQEILESVNLEFAGDKLITKTKRGANENQFRLDESQTPKHIDMEMQGARGEGIYVLENDTLKILHDEVGSARPNSFDLNQSTQLTFMMLKRVKP
jgi:uncharacterized protein (TIGR03067 family)